MRIGLVFFAVSSVQAIVLPSRVTSAPAITLTLVSSLLGFISKSEAKAGCTNQLERDNQLACFE